MNTMASTVKNTMATAHPAPEWLHKLATGKTLYEEEWGWPVSVDIQHHRLVVTLGQALDALTMPAMLGKHVQAALDIMMLAGPVIASPGSQWWTFLTARATEPYSTNHTTLRRLKVYPIPFGAHAVIPTHLDGTGDWRWIHLPRPRRALPPWAVVIGSVRRVTAMSRIAADTSVTRPRPAG